MAESYTSKVTKVPFSAGQMEALTALCDTLLPSVDISGDDLRRQDLHAPLDDVIRFYQTSASMAGTPQLVGEFIGEKVKHPKIYLAKLALFLLSTWLGTFVLCGIKSLSHKFPYFQRFSKVSPKKREEILLSWSTSFFFLLRILFAALKIFTLLTFFTQVNEKNDNPAWKAIGYSGPDPTRKPDPKSTTENPAGPLHKGIVNLTDQKQKSLHKLQTLGFPISTPKAGKKNPSFVVKCDVAVVGSGSGGGLVAGVLAKAGHNVVVLEKGDYFARDNLSLLEGRAMDQMYLNHGILCTDNMDVLIVAGSTVGGGSAINWSASIRTPRHVAREWSQKHGLKLFETEAYEHALDVVCAKMGVQSEFEIEGFNNMILRKGCENLGYHVENIPRNASRDHYCGWCCLGCADGQKKGTPETWLVDLVESGNGAILTGCEALRVVTEKNGVVEGKGRKRRAVGVEFAYETETGRQIGFVEARVTVVACGAICTPGLLRRSGLRNPNIGRNLRLHPVVMAWGHFPDGPGSWPGPEKRSFEGGIMTAMSKEVANFDTSGYGALIQTPALHPGMFSVVTPWASGREVKARMVKFPRTAHIFALARDVGSGEVISETDVRYEVGPVDAKSLREGVGRALRILAAAGAEEIGTHHREGRVLRVRETYKEELERFVEEESSRPVSGLSSPVCSAHQMGSCRMGVGPKVSVVGPTGESWEVEGLYVADSSVFPTALGVNPMVTVQAVAYCTARAIEEALSSGENVEKV
ncbi:Long-chain-alcohol oxidase FAO4A [Striga hermonthica]|uniref:Long-chain-alcohol oxidase n=1 Tax=Striga hermonthica TaxID=68872 RepID=A0A9N7NMP1_STRHE|nr:Long-chain-alcohol oxidase FAO4A [Striga hermonthica]